MGTSAREKSKCKAGKAVSDKPVIAFRVLHPLFVAIPLITGIDKFFNKITIWENYVSPLLPVNRSLFMRCAGVAEICIGLAVLFRPRIGATLFSSMLGGIVLNLLTIPKQQHIALLDTSLAICSLAFATLLPRNRAEKRE